jgi:hypothetical protein
MHFKHNTTNVRPHKSDSGFAIMFAVVIGTIMLILAASLYSFVGQQHHGIQTILNGEVSHFLAEAGINSSLRVVREAIGNKLNSSNSNQINQILTSPGQLEDTYLNPYLKDQWNKDLEDFTKEIHKSAAIKVEVWLRDFRQMETSAQSWQDEVAREGWLTIESTGYYKDSQRKVIVKRKVKVANTIPPVVSKFTLHIKNAAKNGEGIFNIIRNDYKGMVTDGPKPLICYNHTTPETPLSKMVPSDILKDEKNPEVWKSRGWIWLGNKKTRLNLCSGAGDLGEIFHFYDVSNPNVFRPVKFQTPNNYLPEFLSTPKEIFWDLSSSIVRKVTYSFAHSFVLDGFHDRSNRKESDAMYEGQILSNGEKQDYTSKSSILHLFGDARKSYQSRTKVFGPVTAAFPRYASLDIKPEDPDVMESFEKLSPPPLYLLQSIAPGKFGDDLQINDVMGRKFGGPILKTGMAFANYSEYSSLMSRITEMPYVYSFNTIQDVIEKKSNRQFPSSSKILELDDGNEIELERNGKTVFKGSVQANQILSVIAARTQKEFENISDFWDAHLNSSGELDLNCIVRIKNSARLDLIIPPNGKPTPLKIARGGMIILDQGNLTIRGVTSSKEFENLTLVLKDASSARFSSTQPAHLNLVAPTAELTYSSRLNMLGTMMVSSLYVDQRFQGGKIFYRENQDPTGENYNKFYKSYVSPEDSYWNE